MRKYPAFLLLLILLIPLVALQARQDTVPLRFEITGVNASQMPLVTITANVYDNLAQPVRGLTAADFSLAGELAGVAQITSVENITDNNLPFATVLMIDTSTSMIGSPIERAKQAAHAFVDNIGENDPVAIMTFDTRVNLALDYTTDKAALSAAIDSLQAGGVTALYQGGYDAVQHASESPTPRRAVILLSDGGEFGDQSQVARDAAAQEAVVRGVPVYTIGLGFGFDRTYLQQLSSATNARSYESPTPDELTQIYTDLATLLRSQYVITMSAPLPLDGTQYDLQLQVNTPEGTLTAAAALRAPIPVPVVQLPDLAETLTEPTEVTATILADDPVTSVVFQVTGRDAETLTEPPYTVTIDPANFTPGDYTLTVIATDDDNDAGAGALNFTIGALPSQVGLSPDLGSFGAISTPQTITVQSSGQTPTTAVSVAFNDGTTFTELTEPYSFTIDPIQFPPGENAVTIRVTNEGGVTAEQTFDFTVAPVEPQVKIVGLQDGQSVATPVDFSVQVTAQEDITQISARVGAVTLQPSADGTYTLDPMQLTPGANTLVVTATTVGGRSGTTQVNFMVAALPPRISVSGLAPGETLHEDREVTLDFVTQSPVIHVAFFVDGADLAHEVRPPYGITLRVLDYTPGDHLLRIIADNADGQSSTLDVPFSIAPEPAFTATATAVIATQAAVATATQQAVSTAAAVQATQVAQVTQAAQATGTVVQATQFAQQTGIALQATQAAQATGTQIANASETAAVQIAINATATAAAIEATQSALAATATQDAVDAAATEAAQATATSIQATQVAQATSTQNAVNATATQIKVEATATQSALNVTATQLVIDATATREAVNATATQSANNATATRVLLQALSVQATATDAARATALAAESATSQVQMTATALAQQTATRDAQLTATRLALNATATQTALAATATRAVEQTGTALAVQQTATAEIVRITATQQAILAATGNAQATQQALAESTGTAVAQATANGIATEVFLNQQATQQIVQTRQAVLEATQGALDASATQAAANTTATAAVRVTQTGEAIQQATQQANATATERARATGTAVVQVTQTGEAIQQATQQANATATENVRATATAVAQSAQAAQSTMRALIAAQAQVATRSSLATANAEARLEAQATRDARATRSALNVTATQNAQNMTATAEVQRTQSAFDATATQSALNATATAESRQTLTALEETATQFVVNATATRHALETQSAADATATQTARDATATLEAGLTQVAQVTQNAVVTQNAAATLDRAALLTVTAQQLANYATATAGANATLRASVLATDTSATQASAATATQQANATATLEQATLDTRLTAVGPTMTPVSTEVQAGQTVSPQPSPTLTEIQAQEPPVSSNIAPILIVVIVILVIIIVLVLIMRGRGTPPPR